MSTVFLYNDAAYAPCHMGKSHNYIHFYVNICIFLLPFALRGRAADRRAPCASRSDTLLQFL